MLVFVAPILYFFGDIFIEMIFIKPSEPIIKYGEFPFEIKYEYEYEGESGIIKDTIIYVYMNMKEFHLPWMEEIQEIGSAILKIIKILYGSFR